MAKRAENSSSKEATSGGSKLGLMLAAFESNTETSASISEKPVRPSPMDPSALRASTASDIGLTNRRDKYRDSISATTNRSEEVTMIFMRSAKAIAL